VVALSWSVVQKGKREREGHHGLDPHKTMEKDHAKCSSMLEFAVSRNKRIQTLVDSIEALGCVIPKDFFVCRSAVVGMHQRQ
jgi:hypothetical protein